MISDAAKLEERAFVPVDNILKGKGSFTQAKVLRIEEGKEGDGGVVVLDNGEHMAYRVLVTGACNGCVMGPSSIVS